MYEACPHFGGAPRDSLGNEREVPTPRGNGFGLQPGCNRDSSERVSAKSVRYVP